MDPPPYEAIEPSHGHKVKSWNPHEKIPTRLNLRDEVYVSRVQHVAALVAQLLPHVRARAQQGLSKTGLLILPSDVMNTTRGQLVGFPEESVPIVIQLEGGFDVTQFWTQDQVLALLHEQILAAIVDELPKAEDVQGTTLPVRTTPGPKPSFWGRRQSKAVAMPVIQPATPPVTVHVESDMFSFRAESQYGLFETQRTRAVLVTVDVK